MLVDQYGNSISSNAKFFRASAQNYSELPREIIRPLESFDKLVSQNDFRTLSYLSEKLLNGFPAVLSMIEDKATLAVGSAWAPVFHGENIEWNKICSDWLVNEFYPIAFNDGTDFITNLWLASTQIDIVGESVILQTTSESGFPQLSAIPARQIGQWEDRETVVKSGPYKGLKISSGVIRNPQNRPVAYRILGEKEGEFQDISSLYIKRVKEPKFINQVRGVPLFSGILNDLRTCELSQRWELIALLAASSISLIETTPSGFNEDDGSLSSTIPSSPAAPLEAKMMFGGMVRHLKAGTGQDLKQFISERPTQEWHEFQDRIIRSAAAQAAFPYSFWKPEGNGVITRVELERARNSVRDRIDLLFPFAKSLLGYAISKAIKEGILPEYKGADKLGYLNFTFTTPAELSVDLGRDWKSRIDAYSLGLKTASEIVAEESGLTWEQQCVKFWRDKAIREKARLQVEQETGIKLNPDEMPNPKDETPPDDVTSK